MNIRLSKIVVITALIGVCSIFQGTALADSKISYKWNHKPAFSMSFPEPYSHVAGVLTFRGSHTRSAPAYGAVDMKKGTASVIWEKKTRTSSWGGGAGWTGQPVIIQWSPEVLQTMNVKDKFLNKPNFTEVICGSLDGYVYFLDLETGEETRTPIRVGNPIKGSVSVDSRGYPLLYVGEGVPENGTIGFHIYSLTNQKKLFSIQGKDSFAHRKWGAFDGSALFNREQDTLVVGGENGLLYQIKLNTTFNPKLKTITIKPSVHKYRYTIKGNQYQGIENSVAISKDLAFFADNGGSLQALSLKTSAPIWSLPATDDTDATIVIEEEKVIPYLYTGTEVDKQGIKGNSILRKIDGNTGKIIWQKEYPCFTLLGDHPVNGGLLATPVLGKKSMSNMVIFTIARYGTFNGGLMVALDKQSGKELWRHTMKSYSWSSPVDVYDKAGNAHLLQADSSGNLAIIDALTGKLKSSMKLGTNIEASPVVFENYVVVASRNGKYYGLKLL